MPASLPAYAPALRSDRPLPCLAQESHPPMSATSLRAKFLMQAMATKPAKHATPAMTQSMHARMDAASAMQARSHASAQPPPYRPALPPLQLIPSKLAPGNPQQKTIRAMHWRV